MTETIPLYQQGPEGKRTLRGEVRCTSQGMYQTFQVQCRRWESGPTLYRLWLEQGAEGLLLGTLQPEGETLTLRRTLSTAELARQGVPHPAWGLLLPSGGDQPPSSPQWQRLDTLPLVPEDGVLRQCLAHPPAGGGWCRWSGGYRLRFPWRVGEPLPLLPLFCFAGVEQGAVCFWLTEGGGPVTQPMA